MQASKSRAEEVVLDLGRYELRRSGTRIKLEKKPMELLIFLVSRREQLVTRDDIVKQLWRSSLFVDAERSVNNVIRKIRTALGDDAENPRFLETIVGKGYRFIGTIKVIAAQYAESPTSTLEASSEQPSIAVLPLAWLGKEIGDSGLSLGFADALVASLGNLPGIDVLPASAALGLPLEITPTDAAAQLAVRFVVHGAIQTSKGQLQVSVEMYDAHLRRPCFTRKCEFGADRFPSVVKDIASHVAGTLSRPLAPNEQRSRHSRDRLAYAEFMRGYQLTATGDAGLMETASQHLAHAVTRDPNFALAHAMLSFACATRHFEFDPVNSWLEKAEFHCRRALELAPDLAEGYLARAFILWGPSKNFQHVQAIADLKRAIGFQSNLAHAYNRLGTILAHIGLLEHARAMFQRARPFNPRKEISTSIGQVYHWNQEYEPFREHTRKWQAASPKNKYANYLVPQAEMMIGDWDEASRLTEIALQSFPNEPMIIGLQGVLYALMGRGEAALDCVTKACAIPKSFGHAHHTYYHIACIFAITERLDTAFDWLDRSVSTGFACWPFFLKDPCIANLRGLPEFELLINTLQAKYPDHLGIL